MGAPSTDLHSLVQSMTADEKRWFRISGRRFKNGRMVINQELFSAVAEQPEYDEGALKERFREVLNDNQFAVAKNYLYKSILKSLAAYEGERGSTRKIRQLLRMLEVLYHKELKSQCEKLLRRAEALALKRDDPLLLHEVFQWRIRLWNKRHFEGVTQGMVAAHNARMAANLSQISVYGQVEMLNHSFMYLLRTGGYLQTPDQARAMYNEILNAEVLQKPDMAGSLATKIPAYHTWSLYHWMTGNIAESHRHNAALVQILEQHPDMVHDYFDYYLSVVYSYGVSSLHLDLYEEVARAIRKMELFKASFSVQKARLFYYSHILKTEYFFGTLQFEKGFAENKLAWDRYAQLRTSLNPTERISLCFTLAYVFFAKGDYATTNKIIVEEMQRELLPSFPDMVVIVQMLKLILYFEMEEQELFSQAWRSLYRYLLERKNRYVLENLVLQFIRKAGEVGGGIELKPLLKEFRMELQRLAEDPKSARSIQYFNFFTWLDSKINGTSLLEAIRKNQQRTAG